MRTYIFFVLVICSLLLSCEQTVTTNSPEKDITTSVINLDTAKELIRQWIYDDYNPNMNPSMEFSVKEITTKDVLNKLGAQVFIVLCNVPGLANRALFIKNRNVCDLGESNLWGAGEIESMIVTDLDNDNKYELCYTITHGSGILRTNIICFINTLNDTLLTANISFLLPLDYEIKLQSKDYKNLNVIYNKDIKELTIGIAKLAGSGSNTNFIIELNDKVPADLLKHISVKK